MYKKIPRKIQYAYAFTEMLRYTGALKSYSVRGEEMYKKIPYAYAFTERLRYAGFIPCLYIFLGQPSPKSFLELCRLLTFSLFNLPGIAGGGMRLVSGKWIRFTDS